MSATYEFTRAELMIAAAARAWRDDGEVLATGIGTGPRIAAGLARLAHNPGLMLTDGEAYLVESPVPLGPREPGYKVRASGWMGYSRVFDCLWGGRRHALVMPTQIDRFGQANISCLGGTHAQPKTQLLGARGFPGNSIHHANSFFVPAHSTRALSRASRYGLQRGLQPGAPYRRHAQLRRPARDRDRPVRDGFRRPGPCRSRTFAAPRRELEQVQAATGFALANTAGEVLPETAPPSPEELRLIARLDPHNLRATIVRGNPSGRA